MVLISAAAVKYLVKYIDLLLAQRIFKRYAEFIELIGELGGVDFTLSVIIHRINHLYLSFRFYCCKTNRPNFTKLLLLRCCLRHAVWKNDGNKTCKRITEVLVAMLEVILMKAVNSKTISRIPSNIVKPDLAAEM